MNTIAIIVCITRFNCLFIRSSRECRGTVAKVITKGSKPRPTVRNREVGVDENRRITRSMTKAMLEGQSSNGGVGTLKGSKIQQINLKGRPSRKKSQKKR